MTKQEEKMRECISSLEKEERELQGRLDHVTLVLKEKRTLLSLIETCEKIIANGERNTIPLQTA